MSQPIALGTILGGRYKVSASLLSTADDDHVLQGEDQILRRRVSILVPAAAHESAVVENARALAAGAGHSGFQVLDMGQTEEVTYLVTSYSPAPDLLDALLFRNEDSDDYSLSDDIFGSSRTASSSSYVYQEPDPTQPQQRVASEDVPPEQPPVTRWSASDYDDYDSAPAAPSVRNRLGIARRIRPGSVRATMFDRAASRGGADGATVAAGAIDPSYDGDNRYESYERTEGKADRLQERSAGSRAAGREAAARPADDDAPSRPVPGDDAASPVRTTAGGSDAAAVGESTGAVTPPSSAVPGAAAAATGAAPVAAHEPEDLHREDLSHGGEDRTDADRTDLDRDTTGRGGAEDSTGTEQAAAGAPSAGAADGASATGATARDATAAGAAGATSAGGDSRRGPLRWLLLLLLAILLIAAIVLGFRGLGALTGQFAHEGPAQENAAPGGSQGPGAASSSPKAAMTPEVASVTRVTPDPAFMADTDATLNQATDGNPSTYWLSYGFSNATFGNLTDSVGLAAQLKEPATAQELSLQQANGSGGQFTVYVADEPSFQGAQEVGRGSFTGPEIRVPLSDAARSTAHRYVLVKWTELPRLTSPIGGYPYGLRIGEVAVR